ncbi:MAG: zinc-ribbon domain-containing protein [Bacteroidales bacterium]|nr:zinc-ribbon domain-containing protein [Bacteroidales bacterium]
MKKTISSGEIPVSGRICDSCGAELTQNAKFCANCGKAVSQKLPEEKKTKIPAKRKRAGLKVFITFLVLIMISGAVYYFYFYNKGITKTLLTSFELLPNDTTELVFNYKDELEIHIPPGQIKEKDSLHLYAMENIDKPEFTEGLLRAYDFDFDITKSFSEDVAVTFSYATYENSNVIGNGMGVHVMYYNEETESWENTDAIIDKKENKITVSRSHFSCLGLVSYSTAPHPMMQAMAMIDPSTLNYVPDFSKAQSIMNSFNQQKEPGANAVGEGLDLFTKAFDITALAGDIHEKIMKYETFSKFNNLAGQLGIMRSAVSLGVQLGKAEYLDAILNVTKTAVKIKLGVMGWQFLAIYNVAEFLYDLHQEQLQAEGEEFEMQENLSDYYHYNATENPYARSIEEWAKYIEDNIDKLIDFEWQLNQEINKYLNAYFETGVDVPLDVKDKILKHESLRIKGVIKEAFELYIKNMKERQEREMRENLKEIKRQMNSIIVIQVNVYGEKEGSKAVRNLPVNIIVKKDQELWSGITDRAGQLNFKCTKLGYLAYGCPETVEVVYEGTTYSGQISIDNSNMAIVRIYLNVESDTETDEDEQVLHEKNSYSSVTINGQTWMAENLNVGHFKNGDPVPLVTSAKKWMEAGRKRKPARCFYDNDPANGEKYGSLYNWYTITDPRGLAPGDWRIPSQEDMFKLQDFVAGGTDGGVKLKSTGTWEYYSEQMAGIDEYGFNALPGGMRGNDGIFYNVGRSAWFWTTTQKDTYVSWAFPLRYDHGLFQRNPFNNMAGFSVRCVK